MERMSASPGAAMALVNMNRDVDVRHVLPAVRVPTLVLNPRDDPVVPTAAGRYIAERIPGAKFVELPGRDHLPWIGNTELVIAELREFLTGVRHEVEIDRVLATILFVDIVGSTARAAALGDTRWRTLLDAFYGAARSEIHQRLPYRPPSARLSTVSCCSTSPRSWWMNRRPACLARSLMPPR